MSEFKGKEKVIAFIKANIPGGMDTEGSFSIYGKIDDEGEVEIETVSISFRKEDRMEAPMAMDSKCVPMGSFKEAVKAVVKELKGSKKS